MVNLVKQIGTLMEDASSLVSSDSEAAVSKIVKARDVLSSTSGLRRTEPDYNLAVALYGEKFMDLDAKLLDENVDLQTRNIRGHI